MRNNFDVLKYVDAVKKYGPIQLQAYAQDMCPPDYPLDFNGLDGFRNNQILVCGRPASQCCTSNQEYGGLGNGKYYANGIYSPVPNIFYRPPVQQSAVGR